MSSSSNSNRVVIVGGARTPFARARSVYAKMPAASLGGVVLREAVTRTGVDPKLIGEIYMGIVSAPSDGPNVAREALFDSGLPPEIPCTTINRYCASSAEAAAGIMAKIQSGQIDIGIAAGVESISSIQALFSRDATDFFQDFARMKTLGQRLGHLAKFKMAMMAPHAPGIKEATTGLTMGQSADLMAREFRIGREDQDAFALDSHQKAAKGWDAGFYRSHVCTVATPSGKLVERDTDVRADSSLEKLAKLKPVFYKDGTITAGNASPLTDGASAVMLASESRARELGLPILGVIRSVATAAIDIKKEPLLIGPAYAMPRALKAAGITWDQLDLFEIHEAFAGQVLSTIKAIESTEWCKSKLGLDRAITDRLDRTRLNIHGGSIPLGHPFGATGGRMILQTVHALREQKKNLGLISICAASGLGQVMVIEAV